MQKNWNRNGYNYKEHEHLSLESYAHLNGKNDDHQQ